MKYRIVGQRGKIIAAFVNESDRDMCLDLFREQFDDCHFIADELID